MLFNSFWFLMFFPTVMTLYFLTPHRLRWLLLLASSYYFYASWKLEYLALIIASTLIDYIAGIQISNTKLQWKKKAFLIASLVVNLGILFSFKYWNFFSDSLRELLSLFLIQWQPTTLNVLLPIGISFYTFQTLSYTIDVYRGKQKPERHLGIFALYVSFFPQLVAGPIERAKHLIPQLRKKRPFRTDQFQSGFKLVIWGLFKKMVIADNIALFVNPIYNNPAAFLGDRLIIATVLFGIQIYCDFSGYTDIARGTARMMGIDLIENFRRPFFSQSVQDFWRRWHMSLMSWFRDYIYIPLGGSRVSKKRWYLNIMAVFLISGLWHGAAWTFVVWGFLHGFFILVTELTKRPREALAGLIGLTYHKSSYALVKIFVTFLLVNFAWIFFRANSLSDAFYIATHLFSNLSSTMWFYVMDILFILFPLLVVGYLYLVSQRIGAKKYLAHLRHRISLLIVAILMVSLIVTVFLWFQSFVLLAFLPVLFIGLRYAMHDSGEFAFIRNSLWMFKLPAFAAVLLSILVLGSVVNRSLPILFIPLFSMEFIHFAQERWNVKEFVSFNNYWARLYVSAFVILYLILFGVFQAVDFIYFQF